MRHKNTLEITEVKKKSKEGNLVEPMFIVRCQRSGRKFVERISTVTIGNVW